MTTVSGDDVEEFSRSVPADAPYIPARVSLSEFYRKDKTMTKEEDQVNQPSHYNTGEIECIDYLKDNMPAEAFKGYLEGCAKKYLHRYRYKGKASQDIAKAIWYMTYLQKELEK
jgi:hypothetical protein